MSISRVAAAAGAPPAWVVENAVYSGDSLDLSFIPNPLDMVFKPDGMSFYICSSGDGIYQYDMTDAWDITTATYFDTYSILARGISFKPDGLRLYVTTFDGIEEYALGSAWDLSTASFTRATSILVYTKGLWISSDGTKVYYTDRRDPSFAPPYIRILERVLTTPWNITTVSTSTEYQGLSFGVSPGGFTFSSDDQYFAYIRTSDSGAGASLASEKDGSPISSLDLEWAYFSGVHFRDDGRVFFVLSATNDALYKYTIV